MQVQGESDNWHFLPWFAHIVPLLIALGTLCVTAWQVKKQLRHQSDEQARQFHLEHLRKRAELLRASLGDFYRPYKQLSDTNKLLHDSLRQGKGEGFRLLHTLLDSKFDMSENDRALSDEIVSIGRQLEGLLSKHSGYVDSAELRKVFGQAGRHFRVLSLAAAGSVQGERDRLESVVYPRELDGLLDSRIRELESQLARVDEKLARAGRRPLPRRNRRRSIRTGTSR